MAVLSKFATLFRFKNNGALLMFRHPNHPPLLQPMIQANAFYLPQNVRSFGNGSRAPNNSNIGKKIGPPKFTGIPKTGSQMIKMMRPCQKSANQSTRVPTHLSIFLVQPRPKPLGPPRINQRGMKMPTKRLHGGSSSDAGRLKPSRRARNGIGSGKNARMGTRGGNAGIGRNVNNRGNRTGKGGRRPLRNINSSSASLPNGNRSIRAIDGRRSSRNMHRNSASLPRLSGDTNRSSQPLNSSSFSIPASDSRRRGSGLGSGESINSASGSLISRQKMSQQTSRRTNNSRRKRQTPPLRPSGGRIGQRMKNGKPGATGMRPSRQNLGNGGQPIQRAKRGVCHCRQKCGKGKCPGKKPLIRNRSGGTMYDSEKHKSSI